MTEAQIRHMVDRFLGWQLPEDFAPDGGIKFTKIGNAGAGLEYEFVHEPSGTNLFDANQADAMVRYMLDGLPADMPSGVYWSPEAGNFYDAQTHKGMGLDFYKLWKERKDEFPAVATTAAPALDLNYDKRVAPLKQ